MAILLVERAPIASSEDVIRVRQLVRDCVVKLGFSLVEQTKMVTAASELARNTLEHGGGGDVTMEEVHEGIRRGLRVRFSDQGPGIPNLDQALKDGFTTGQGLGLGLSGSKRLVNEFYIESKPGKGTSVTIVRWK